MGMYPTINLFYLNVLKCYYHLCVKRQGEKTICTNAIRLYNNNLLIHVEVASKLGDVEILNWFKNVLGYFSHYLLRCTQSIWKRRLLLQHGFYVEWIVCLWCVPILELLFIKSSIIFPLYGDWQRWINWSVVSFFGQWWIQNFFIQS